MQVSIQDQIRNSAKFQELVHKRSRFAWRLSLVMLAVYYGFVMVIAFDPALFGRPLSEGSVTTLGIPVGLAVIIIAFVLTGIYVRRANSEFDRLTAEIVEETRA